MYDMTKTCIAILDLFCPFPHPNPFLFLRAGLVGIHECIDGEGGSLLLDISLCIEMYLGSVFFPDEAS